MTQILPYTQNDLNECVILVNEKDEQVGIEAKLKAHKEGMLHRAFSVFIYDTNGHMLLQQRSDKKYHGRGEWANAACGHPRPGERVCAAATRRLEEEMGIRVEKFNERLTYIYRVPMKEGLIEHEYLHVLFGQSDAHPQPNPDEVKNFAWMYPEAINSEIIRTPDKYAFWFKESMNKLYTKEPTR